MNIVSRALLLAVTGLALAGAAPAYAQKAAAVSDRTAVAPMPQAMSMRQALAGVHADAAAILNALQSDPTLAAQLAKNPAEGSALLRSRGATRAETIIVEPVPGDLRTITITIIIGDIKIVITIKL